MCLHALQSKLKSGEEPYRPGADDERIHLLRSRCIQAESG